MVPRPAQLTAPSPKLLLSEIHGRKPRNERVSRPSGPETRISGADRLTRHVAVTVIVQATPGHRLATKQRVAVKVVAQLLQEAEDVGDAADGGQGQGVLLLLEVGWVGEGDHRQSGRTAAR